MELKNRAYYINNIGNDKYSDEEVARAILKGIVDFDELRDTEKFDFERQSRVEELMNKLEPIVATEAEADRLRVEAETIEAEAKAELIKTFEEVKKNPNNYTPGEIKDFNEGQQRELCNLVGVEFDILKKFNENQRKLDVTSTDNIPETEEQVPLDFTDVFFWGIPSSGKTCAISVILRTMKDKYEIKSAPIKVKFGAKYRIGLANLFENEIGHLPGGTVEDFTRYMPFLLARKDEKYHRQISFFELSGEVFRYLFEKQEGSNILEPETRIRVEKTFKTLELLLKSENRKIHFFFIDYQKETEGYIDKYGLTQDDYLTAAANYFEENNNIFEKKTDAVYIMFTKADRIEEEDKKEYAKNFLIERCGNFCRVIKKDCEKTYHVPLKGGIFSIGDVYFQRICKINYNYAIEIIEAIIKSVKPVEEGFLGWLKRWLRR